MAKKHLKNEPHQLPENFSSEGWWYEEMKGIDIHMEVRLGGQLTHESFFIPWKDIRAALKRKDKV